MKPGKLQSLLNACERYDKAKKSLYKNEKSFFNLPDGWLSCYHDRGIYPEFSIFERRLLKEKDSIEIRIVGDEVSLKSIGGYTYVDWYLLRKCWGEV